MKPDTPLDSLKGIGEKTRLLFERAGIENLGDLLSRYPRAYEQYGDPKPIRELQEGEVASVPALLSAPVTNRFIRGKCISTAICSDREGELLLTWYNMPYLKNSLHTGIAYIFRGKVKKKGKRMLIEQPAVFHTDQYRDLTSSLQPVYSLTQGMSARMIQKAVRQALEDGELTKDPLPEEIRKKYGLCPYADAVAQMHFPQSREDLQTARSRLVFDEFFFFLLQLRQLKKEREKSVHDFCIRPRGTAQRVIEELPYRLTGAQQRVWSRLEQELGEKNVMARLIQGDVGSGKTILAVLALLTIAENGLQGALMAPTEVLARQHYAFVKQLLADHSLPFEAVLLTGSMTPKQKREAYGKLSSGEAQILIGTHALIQEKVQFQNLALVITDEQHRFGVLQRESLSLKGNMPHTIVMSATPIPRTLAVILYGDLDVSVIDEMPSNRLPIKNCVVGPGYRPKAYAFIEKQVQEGHQAYVICPMVEESDLIDAENVIEYAQTLRSALHPDITVEYLHGRMRPAKKNDIMQRFLNNEIQVLVSTTVVEVGVNVPNATVMLIENAERFGLAQLHQLRGRVGRGDAQSYCIFLYTTDNARTRERLEILNHSNDGFEIAAQDMKLRGPGDLFGIRQSGMMEFHLADIYADSAPLGQANEAVGQLLSDDPLLEKPEHRQIREHCEHQKQRQQLNL